jgi:hypothetical protein
MPDFYTPMGAVFACISTFHAGSGRIPPGTQLLKCHLAHLLRPRSRCYVNFWAKLKRLQAKKSLKKGKRKQAFPFGTGKTGKRGKKETAIPPPNTPIGRITS